MAVEAQVFDWTFKNTDSTGGPNANGDLPQFAATMYDTANAFGCVNAGSTGAGPVIGINQSKGIDPTTGAITANVKTGQSCEVRLEGLSRAAVSGATGIGQPLSVQNTSGQVGGGAGPYSGGLVGYGIEAGGVAGDIITLLINPGLQPALKQLGTVAAPLVANAVAGTQNAHAHGLGYIPHIVLLVSAGATGTGVVYLSAAADATNIYEKNTVASGTFIAYVA